MKNYRKTLGVFLLLFVILTGCASVEDVSKETVTEVENAFNSESPKANVEHGSISFFLPEDMKIDEKGETDFILSKGDQMFILFVNPNESINSEVLYEGNGPKDKDLTINKTFKDDKRFGYIKAYEIEDDNYLVSVGVGGIKMTTETKLSEISENSKEMMEIVSSLKY